MLDPFELQPGWFRLELVGFQVLPGEGLSDELRSQVQATIDRLGLNGFCDDRAEDAEVYWSGDISLAILQRESPFVAQELERQGRL